MLTDFLQTLIYGLIYGGVLSLGAIGASLIFSILRFSNFAHGDLMTAGAYLAFTMIAGFGWPVWAALPVGMAGGALLALLLDRLVYARLRRTQPVILLIASFGMAMVLRGVVMLVWGVQDRALVTGIRMPLRFGDLRIRPDHLGILAGCLLLVAGLHLFLTRTATGKSMRALADNMDLAKACGIDTERVILWAWGLGGALAGAAGVFLALDTRLTPVLGWTALLPVFAAAILGGYGSVGGAILGGMVIGLVSELSTLILDPAYKPAIAFAVMVLILLIRPQGLRGAKP